MIKLGEVVMILDLHRQGLTVSAIARELGVDRKTVRRCIARGLETPVYGPRKPRKRLIDHFVPYLRERVVAYPGLTGRRLWRELRERGYEGGYTAVTDVLHDIRPASLPAFEVRFETPPGDQAQVDFAQFQLQFTDEPDDHAHRLAVLVRARLQPVDLGALRSAPGYADGSALPHGGVRGDRRHP